MRPFDIEAARRGEPIQARYSGRWVDAEFVGIHAGAAVVYVSAADVEYGLWTDCHLRMKPRRRTVWVNIYPDYPGLPNVGGKRAVWHDNEEDARARTIVDAIAVAVPIEIIEE